MFCRTIVSRCRLQVSRGYPGINGEKHYFKKLDRQELAGNGDHYPFAQRNVPCIFFMNEGGDAFKYYHTFYDTWKNALFGNYKPTVKLVMDFIEKY